MYIFFYIGKLEKPVIYFNIKGTDHGIKDFMIYILLKGHILQ